MNRVVETMYFSPTHNSYNIVRTVSDSLMKRVSGFAHETNLTLPAQREKNYTFTADDVLLLGFPVYRGRVPLPLREALQHLQGDNTPVVLIASYGNRAYDDALVEARDILHENGFIVIAAAAFIGKHTYSKKLGVGRPDANDLSIADGFGRQVAGKINARTLHPAKIKGNVPYCEQKHTLSLIPLTNKNCSRCLVCVEVCPMGAISRDDPASIAQSCIGCSACVEACPSSAKFFDAAVLDPLANMLETANPFRRETEFFF